MGCPLGYLWFQSFRFLLVRHGRFLSRHQHDAQKNQRNEWKPTFDRIFHEYPSLDAHNAIFRCLARIHYVPCEKPDSIVSANGTWARLPKTVSKIIL